MADPAARGPAAGAAAPPPAKPPGNSFVFFLKNYWRGIFLIVYPILLIPLIVIQNTPAIRCMYIISVMAGYWITEVLPLGVTALMPIVFFPLMGILDTAATSLCYFKDTNMMFLGGIILAIAVEHSNLHRRVALKTMILIGSSPRKLHLGLSVVTMFISMWIVNTAAAAMMCPIGEAVMLELESQGIQKMYTNRENLNDPNFNMDTAKPTKTTTCIFLSIAFSSSIGGVGTMIGTGTNLTLKGIYDTAFPDAKETPNFTNWLIYGIPIMLACEILVILWMQLLYLGMFRPKSADAKANSIVELGPMSFQEVTVLILFILAIILWFFRKPQFMPGWAEYVTKMKVKDATPAIFISLLLFLCPATNVFLKVFSKKNPNRDPGPTEGIITWKIVHAKMQWGLILLLGGGFALADGSKNSGMSAMIGEFLAKLRSLPSLAVVVGVLLFVTVLTQIFSSNVAVANLVLPILANMSAAAKYHPLKLMLPAAIACSYAYCLPSSTPPNAIAAVAANIPNKEMIKAGAGAAILSITITVPLWLLIGGLLFPINTYPAWAKINATSDKAF